MDKKFLDDFKITIESAAVRLAPISQAQSEVPVSKGKWSRKEIVGHLIDSAANNHQRFVRAQFSDDLICQSYYQDQWVSSQHYQEAPWAELIELWKRYNFHLVFMIARIPDSALAKSRTKHNLHKIAYKTVDEDRPTTLEYLIRDYLDHLKHHLEQIFSSTP